MAALQQYVSEELSHFVGRCKSEEEQYEILVEKILKPGKLLRPPHDDVRPRTARLDLSKPISADKILDYEVICFCDIPVQDLAIHTAKYSRFGLSFKKSFLIAKGACPVFYVANESSASPVEHNARVPGDFRERVNAQPQGSWTRGLYFDLSVRRILDLLVACDVLCFEEAKRYFNGITSQEFEQRLCCLLGVSTSQVQAAANVLKNSSAQSTVRAATDFLLNYVFTYMKCFPTDRKDEDVANYYMEREWRTGENISFELADVARVFFPSKYAGSFRSDVPDYVGQVTFLD